jgi:RNA polymerase sigma-70 factor (ECF subfamily)
MIQEPISPERLAALWVQAQPKIAGFVSALVRDRNLADDILQNVAMIAVRKRTEYDTSMSFTSWVIQIAKFEVLAHRRNHARQQIQFSDALIEQVAEAYQGSASVLNARRDALALCMQEVRSSDRELLRLRYAEGMHVNEIAVHVGKTAANARMILARIRKVLRNCIERRLKNAEGGL